MNATNRPNHFLDLLPIWKQKRLVFGSFTNTEIVEATRTDSFKVESLREFKDEISHRICYSGVPLHVNLEDLISLSLAPIHFLAKLHKQVCSSQYMKARSFRLRNEVFPFVDATSIRHYRRLGYAFGVANSLNSAFGDRVARVGLRLDYENPPYFTNKVWYPKPFVTFTE